MTEGLLEIDGTNIRGRMICLNEKKGTLQAAF